MSSYGHVYQTQLLYDFLVRIHILRVFQNVTPRSPSRR